MRNLILILGDQLSENISSLKEISKDDYVVMIETKSETNKIQHHRRKIVFLFSAMRHFFDELLKRGFNGRYFKLNDADNEQGFFTNLRKIIAQESFEKIIVTEPSEYHLLELFKSSLQNIRLPFEIRADNRFLVSKDYFKNYAKSSKSLRLEDFYRTMRKETGYLMNNGRPQGGKWNFDHDNRCPYKGQDTIPNRPSYKPDKITINVLEMVQKEFPNRFGSIENFSEAVNREQALNNLEFFTEHCLQNFGKYQDAMIEGEPYGFHSRISHLINCGLLEIREVCEKVLSKRNEAPLSSIEGFIRQIIGWREYIRGIYWLKMPEYLDMNYLKATRSLPSFYWTAKCEMNCLKQVVENTEKTAYSHHIHRLMITGNFALLTGINPKEVHEWYLAVYDDAYEWVELPNTMGMALFADGGEMSTKPYAASGNYINKMSDYCKSCKFDVKRKTGPSACPFNFLYWNFLDTNKKLLSTNRRLSMPYRNLSNKSPDDLMEIQKCSESFLQKLSD